MHHGPLVCGRYGLLVSPVTWIELVLGDPDNHVCVSLTASLGIFIVAAVFFEKVRM